MSDLIDAIIKTRETAAQILIRSLINLENNSEVEIRNKILVEVKNHQEIYPEGWYIPPPGGVGILATKKPFERLKYESLRKPECWPKEDLHFEKESALMVYLSPVDRKTNMLGDIGLTIYRGDDEQIKEHIKKSYDGILAITKHAKVGMTFPQLCEFATNSFKGKFEMTRWVTVNSNPNHSINLGHTIPGSFEKNFNFGDSFEEIKETIKMKRVPFTEVENFKIPDTCAFTVESRLSDPNNLDLPSVYFHFIVCFDNGQKTILENYSEIFKVVGMDYMNKK